MGKISVDYNRGLIKEMEEHLIRMRTAFEAMAAIIENPTEHQAETWFVASDDYTAAVDAMNDLPECFINPEDLRDPDDTTVKDILKTITEKPTDKEAPTTEGE